MQKFTYRTPRFPVDLPVRLMVDGNTIHARCREISREGMRLEVSESLPPNTRATVALAWQNHAMEIPVEVSHSGLSLEGVRFVFSSDQQRCDVAHLVSLLAARRGPMGLTRVK